jgi:ribosome biogenesis GTPase / thiamine phosphate phosphatase
MPEPTNRHAHAHLEPLGWRPEREHDVNPDDTVARIGVEHRGYYDLYGLNPDDPMDLSTNAAVTSTFRRAVTEPTEFPAVGDWVVVRPGKGHRGSDAIDRVLPRGSEFVRRAPGREPKPQVVGANIDVVLIVTSADADLSPRRLERYLAVVHGGGATPVIVVSKADAAADLEAARAVVHQVSGTTKVIATSIIDDRGVAEVHRIVGGGRTVALVGSSGVGKSSLTNALIGDDVQDVQATRSDGKGRHTTIRRHLLPIASGGFLLDTPGIREVQLWEFDGLPIVFDEIYDVAADCRFSDCLHRDEPGCAVRGAVADGRIDPERLTSLHQLEAEIAELDDALEDRRRRQGEGRRPELALTLDQDD